jgi:diguanylate cyclase (GGDEF)-like protein
MKILVIEKNEENRHMLDQCLSSLGHLFHHAQSGEQALRFIGQHPIDCVFIDIDIERDRTAETLASIRAAQKNEWFPIVALSAATDDEAFAHAILAGADALLQKPLSQSRVLMQVIALERIYNGRQDLQAKKELLAANLALLKLSMYDEITGLANRRYFEETLFKEMKQAKREGCKLTLLICEIGNAAPLPEAGGGDAENRLLYAVAAAIAAVPSRPTDFVCRYGGLCCAVLLPNTGAAGARHIAAKVQAAAEAVLADPALCGQSAPQAFRIGSATHEGQFQTPEGFIDAASASLKHCPGIR